MLSLFCVVIKINIRHLKVMNTYIKSTAAFEDIVTERLSADEIITFTFHWRLSVTIHLTPASLLTGVSVLPRVSPDILVCCLKPKKC